MRNFVGVTIVSFFLFNTLDAEKTPNKSGLDREIIEGMIQQSDDISSLSEQVIELRNEVKRMNEFLESQGYSYPFNRRDRQKNPEYRKRKNKSGIDPEIIGGMIQQSEDISELSEEIAELRKVLKMQNEFLQRKGFSTLESSRSSSFSWKQFGKSLVLPGWGHFSTESRWKSYLYASLFFASSYNAYTKYEEFTSLGKEYANPVPQYLILTQQGSSSTTQQLVNFVYSNGEAKKLEKAEEEANIAAGIVGFVYLVSAIDAGFSTPKEKSVTGWQFRSKHEAYSALEKNSSVSAEYVWSF